MVQGDGAEPAAKKGRQVYQAGSFCALLDEAEQLDGAVLENQNHELKVALGLAVTTGRETHRAAPAFAFEVRMRLAKELSAVETALLLLRGVGEDLGRGIVDKVKGIWRLLEESTDTSILVVKGLLDEVLPSTWADRSRTGTVVKSGLKLSAEEARVGHAAGVLDDEGHGI